LVFQLGTILNNEKYEGCPNFFVLGLSSSSILLYQFLQPTIGVEASLESVLPLVGFW
jgi:hypothetical protein